MLSQRKSLKRKKVILFLFFFTPFCSYSDVCVKASKAVLRKKPHPQAQVSWVVGRYTPLLVREKKKFWSKVEDVDGKAHWIRNSQLTHKWKCGTVLKRAMTRQSAGKYSPISSLGVVDRYWSFQILKKEENWLYLKDKSGRKVWVFEDLIWRALSATRFSF